MDGSAAALDVGALVVSDSVSASVCGSSPSHVRTHYVGEVSRSPPRHGANHPHMFRDPSMTHMCCVLQVQRPPKSPKRKERDDVAAVGGGDRMEEEDIVEDANEDSEIDSEVDGGETHEEALARMQNKTSLSR